MWTLLNKGEEHAHAADNTKPDGTASRQTKKKGKYETMKRALAMILCVLMVMSLAACGSKDTPQNQTPEPSKEDNSGNTSTTGTYLDTLTPPSTKRALCLGTGSSSGVWYILGGGIANAINLNSKWFTVTNEAASGGGWDFTGAETVKRSAPASIVDPERLGANQELADAVMFGGKSKYEPSEVKIEDEAGSFLNVRVEKADRNGGTFTLENCGDQRITYSDRNFLEKQINGEWNGVVAYNQRTMTEPSYELEPQESIDYQTKWDGLDEGEYRYVVPFSVSGDGNGEVYHAAVSFTVEKVSLWERLTGRV